MESGDQNGDETNVVANEADRHESARQGTLEDCLQEGYWVPGQVSDVISDIRLPSYSYFVSS